MTQPYLLGQSETQLWTCKYRYNGAIEGTRETVEGKVLEQYTADLGSIPDTSDDPQAPPGVIPNHWVRNLLISLLTVAKIKYINKKNAVTEAKSAV